MYGLDIACHIDESEHILLLQVQLQRKSMFVKLLSRVIEGGWEILLGMRIFCIYSFTLCVAYRKLPENTPTLVHF